MDSREAVSDAALSIEFGHLVLRNLNSQEYAGRLGRQHPAASVLLHLHEHCRATFQAVLIRKGSRTDRKSPHDLYFIINGMRGHADSVGDELDKAGLFLQNPPQNWDTAASYFNPHHLHNPGRPIQQPISTSQPEKVRVARKPASTVLEDSGPLKRQIRAVLDSANGPEIYSKDSVLVSPYIRTGLKS